MKIAATKLQDALRPQAKGEPVNAHVVEFVRQPQPDYDALQKTLSGDEKPRAPEAPTSEPATVQCIYEHDCRRARYLKVFEEHSRSTAVAAPPPTPKTA
jgi:hypothetical protein